MKIFLFLFFLLSSNYKKDEVVVICEDGLKTEVLNLISEKGFKISYVSKYLPFFVVKFDPEKEDIENVIEKLKNLKGVKRVTKNAILRPFYIPNDPYYPYQWHFKKIGMETAWNFGFGSSSIKVAVLDDGFAYRNGPIPSYEQNEVISSDGYYHIAPDLQGINIFALYDFYHNDPYPDPSSPHGTHVLGTIAQTTDNNIGVAGIAPSVSIILAQVLGPQGGSASQIAEGISFAVQNGAKIINMSLGGPPGDSTGMSVIHLALKNAYTQGVLLIAAAGNSSVSKISYPAGFKECIAVGATDYRDSLSYYSQYGFGLDIVAPGGDLTVDRNNDLYADGILQNTCYESQGKPRVDSFAYFFFQGTSMASPHVAGIAALCLSLDQYLTNLDLRRILTGTAVDLGKKGYDTIYGFGRISAEKAVSFSAQTQYIVYPGDTDANGIVNEMDVLPLGIYFGLTGPVRNLGDNFSPQPAQKWIPRMATFADCNGDGVINEQDVLTIGKNFGLTHPLNYFVNSFSTFIPEIEEKSDFFYLLYRASNNKEIKKFLSQLLNITYEDSDGKIVIFERKIEADLKKIKIFDISGRKINYNNFIPYNYKGIFFILYNKKDKIDKEKRVIVK
ncbi:MAG: S8 family serine peptidase [candidate division WOR-3 bacterium]